MRSRYLQRQRQIQPLPYYRIPEYPTMAQIQQTPELLRHVPRRWTGATKFMAVLGVGLISKAGVAVAADSQPPSPRPQIRGPGPGLRRVPPRAS